MTVVVLTETVIFVTIFCRQSLCRLSNSFPLQPITCNPILSCCQFLNALNPYFQINFYGFFRNRMRLGQDGRNLSEWIRPWFCGLGSGVMDISITFPINKVMFRQQLNGITSKQAINQRRLT